MKTNRTPGPWIAIGYDVRQLGGRMIAYTGPHHTPPDEYPTSCRAEDNANAEFIACACNNYENLINALHHISGTCGGRAWDIANAAIAEATTFPSASEEPGTAAGHNL